MKRYKLEILGMKAVRNLRENKLRSGLPFMINTYTLSSDQCYLEYPNGDIMLVALCRKTFDSKVIKRLSSQEILLLRKKYRLSKLK